MAIELQEVTCPQCQGSGLLSEKEGRLTCPNCNGTGMWLMTASTTTLLLQLPEFFHPRAYSAGQKMRTLVRIGSYTAILATVSSGIWLLFTSGPSLSQLLWERTPQHALFGLTGLAAAFSLSYLQKQKRSPLSLHDLRKQLGEEKASSSFFLDKYANPRLLQLCETAAAVAVRFHRAEIDEEILLLALLEHPRIQVILARLELSPRALAAAFASQLSLGNAGEAASLPLTVNARSRLYQGFSQALAQDFPYLDLEDILLAYASSPDTHQEFFKEQGLEYTQVEGIVRWYAAEENRQQQWQFWLEKGRARPKGYMNKAWTALPTPFLERYGTDITALAAQGAVPAVTVRDAEIEQSLQILGRLDKHNLLLVGEPGVGKNAILGALALRMIEENVPDSLKDKRLVSMDLGALLSHGQSAEQNIQRILEEVAQASNVILVIPNLQNLVGTSNSALDAASLLSDAISRNTLQVVTTATYGEYHRYVEANPGLAALLEVVEVKEVEPEQAVTILQEEAPQIEFRQGVYLTYPAIQAAASLARRYLPDKVLPESAIGLLDQAASAAKLTKRTWVTRGDVEQVIEKSTHIPVREADEREASLLLSLEERMHTKVIGQEEAISAVASALRRARAGLHDNKRPIASFLFVGPTGVGKTETSKALCELYFGNADRMIRFDMSEYQDARAAYKLIGAPPADSASYTEGGTLTQAVREHPYSLLLFDELEKADPTVLNLFLQLLDDGRLTENTGRTVYFSNTIVIATSNAGSTELAELLKKGVTADHLRSESLRILSGYFRPEFLNRFDSIIPFHSLSQAQIEQVVGLMLESVIRTAASRKYELSFTPEAIAVIAQRGFDPVYGARPLRRFIQDHVESLLATKILDRSLLPGQALQITAEMIQ